MQGKARLLGHPVHPMLIVFPLGLLATSLAFDIAWLVTGTARWSEIAFYMIASGLIGGAVAAVFGVIDFLAIPKRTRARRIGAMHGVGNVLVMLLFAVSWTIRNSNASDPAAIGLSIAGVLLALVTGWLGGELVDRLSVGVDEGAHVNAPSSLTDRPAHEHARY